MYQNKLFLSKDELDNIETEAEINNKVRWEILRQTDLNREASDQYIKELVIYCKVRFPENYMSLSLKHGKLLAAEGNILADFLTNKPKELLDWSLYIGLKEINNTFLYIKGMNLEKWTNNE